MFSNKEKNINMILGAYKKLKTYFYYDKTILYNKVRLSTWEADIDNMNIRIDNLATFMTTLDQNIDNEYLEMLLNGISLVPVPKSFQSDINNNILDNTLSLNMPLEKINFFIKAPVELLILDTIWMLMIEKIAFEQKSISPDAYANKIKREVIQESHDLFEGIDFNSNRLFVPYFKQYTKWKNNAFEKVRQTYDSEKDCILISLDIKSYYYLISFDFKSLDTLLSDDNRLISLKPLTNIIEKMFLSYTMEVKKFRNDIRADSNINECLLPIGLLSSMVISNLYLNILDVSIKDKINPIYYGRYVDDIMIVIERTNDIALSIESIMYETFIKNGIMKLINENEYQLLIPDGLLLQQSKIKCINFNHLESDAMIKLLDESNNLKPSGIEMMPDIISTQKTFDESAYRMGTQDGALKVRSFTCSTSNYSATLFLNDLIRTSKNIELTEPIYRENINTQINQILNFYKGMQAIEYRSAWINIFTLLLVTNNYEQFCEFYNQLKFTINKINASSLEFIESNKTEILISKIKESMIEQLNVSASVALAPNPTVCKSNIKDAFLNLNIDIDTNAIYQDAIDIRKSNMFNSHIVSFPLVNYMELNDNISLYEVSPRNICEIAYNSSNALERDAVLVLNANKINLTPRFIHFDEICMFDFLCNFYNGGNPCNNKINLLLSKFYQINNISKFASEYKIEVESKVIQGSLNLQKLSMPFNIREKLFTDFKVAIASINLDEERDVLPCVTNNKHGVTPEKKTELYKMLNQAIENKANMIVFPEYFLPIEWLQEIFTFARKNSIAVITGLHYILNDSQAFNYLAVIQPFSLGNNFKYTLPLIREKNHYAPAEKKILRNKGFNCRDTVNPYTHIVKWKNLHYSDLLCYELTNIEYRYKLRSEIELLIVPELNPDTDYFSNVVESTSRDLHCYVAQVNTSKYGDSRITGPLNSMFKDIVKIKGGNNNIILIGTIPLQKLIDTRTDASVKNQAPIEPRIKKPSAGFYMKGDSKNE